MKVVCIVQARVGSSRLPGKVLLPLNGHTVIGEVLTRCGRIAGVDEVVCAVPRGDANLIEEASKYATVYEGSEHDVLARYVGAALEHDADIVMRITGDCPLISPALCGSILGALEDADYCSNVCPRTFPKGFDCEVFTTSLLLEAHANATGEDREHVTPWMQQHAANKVNYLSPWQLDGRLTLDTEDDYKVICAAFGHEPYQRLHAV
jgi:spore coat polysaccharide biosynthesis protein SpsF